MSTHTLTGAAFDESFRMGMAQVECHNDPDDPNRDCRYGFEARDCPDIADECDRGFDSPGVGHCHDRSGCGLWAGDVEPYVQGKPLAVGDSFTVTWEDDYWAIERTKPRRCPTCDSPQPRLHPAMQAGGEVQPCRDEWHGGSAMDQPLEATDA